MSTTAMAQFEMTSAPSFQSTSSENPPPPSKTSVGTSKEKETLKVNAPMNVATISAGFEKGDFLVREEKGQRVYFDFFEEAFNYVRAANVECNCSVCFVCLFIE